MIFPGLWIKEAIASTAMEHGQGCRCKVCRAAAGDLRAFAEVCDEVMADLDRRESSAPRAGAGEGPRRPKKGK